MAKLTINSTVTPCTPFHMLTSFSVKKALIFAVFLAVFLQYFIYRISKLASKYFYREIVADNYYKRKINFDFSSYEKRSNPIYIKHSSSYSALKNASILLTEYEINQENLINVNGINICPEGHPFEVSTLEEFIRKFFIEAKEQVREQSGPILKYFSNSKCYSVNRNADMNENELKSLGLMISLACFTQTFIHMKFCCNISGLNEYDSFNQLLMQNRSFFEEFDKDHYDVIKNWSSSHRNIVYFNTNPKSNLNIISNNLPIESKYEILEINNSSYFSFLIKRIYNLPKVQEGIKEFFTNYTNFSSKFPEILQTILAPMEGSKIDYLRWLEYSFSSESKNPKLFLMFYKVISKFNPYSVNILFEKWTGMTYLPNEGILRLPKLKIVEEALKGDKNQEIVRFDKVKFIIYISKDCKFEQLKSALEKFVRSFISIV